MGRALDWTGARAGLTACSKSKVDGEHVTSIRDVPQAVSCLRGVNGQVRMLNLVDEVQNAGVRTPSIVDLLLF